MHPLRLGLALLLGLGACTAFAGPIETDAGTSAAISTSTSAGRAASSAKSDKPPSVRGPVHRECQPACSSVQHCELRVIACATPPCLVPTCAADPDPCATVMCPTALCAVDPMARPQHVCIAVE